MPLHYFGFAEKRDKFFQSCLMSKVHRTGQICKRQKLDIHRRGMIFGATWGWLRNCRHIWKTFVNSVCRPKVGTDHCWWESCWSPRMTWSWRRVMLSSADWGSPAWSSDHLEIEDTDMWDKSFGDVTWGGGGAERWFRTQNGLTSTTLSTLILKTWKYHLREFKWIQYFLSNEWFQNVV